MLVNCNPRATIVLSLWLLCEILSVDSVEYVVSWSPQRVKYDSSVTVDFQLKNLTQPLTSVSLRFFYEFFIAEHNQCRTVVTSGAEVNVLKCDFTNAHFIVELQYYKETKTFTIHAFGQQPPNEKFIIPMYKPPQGLDLIVPSNMQAGMTAKLKCEFDLGQNNLANFTWYRVNASRAIPIGRIGDQATFRRLRSEPRIRRKRRNYNFYGDESYFEFLTRPGDEGFYQCSAVYNPQSVGEFFSDTVYFDVKYAPQIDMNRDYFADHDVKLGEKVNLQWSILANPRPSHIFWSRNGVIVKNNAKYKLTSRPTDFGITLSLTFKAHWENFGTFFCFVNNTMGSTQIYFHVRNILDKNAEMVGRPTIVYGESRSTTNCRDLEFDRDLWRIIALALMGFILCALIYGVVFCTVRSRQRGKIRINGNNSTKDKQIHMQRVI